MFGEVAYPPGGRLGPRVQPELQFFIVDSAHAEVEVDGRRVPVSAGEVACLRPGRREVFRFADDQPTVHSWVALSFERMPRALTAALRRLPDCLALTRRMQRIMELGLAEAGPGRAEQPEVTPRVHAAASGWLLHLGAAFYCAWVEAARTGDRTPPAPEAVRRARRFIHEHLTESLELADIADAACVSENHLVRLFRKHTGHTPMRYLWHCRVERGAELLRQTGLSISEIAYQVGFSTPYHFSRLVRQQLGLPPRDIRAAAWSADE